MKHAVVILNYKGWKDTLLCIKSILAANKPPHIYIVDNASPDESVKKIRSKYPKLDLIETNKNLGFSGGNNLGIQQALDDGADVIHILNNDTLVHKDAFVEGYRFVHNKDRITGAKIYYAKGFEFHKKQKNKGNIIWYAGGYIDWSMALAKHQGVDEEDVGQYDKVRDIDFITGCYMAVPRQVFEKIGLLDDKFFLYLEDADFTLRAIKAGIEVKYNPKIVIYHRNSSTTIAGSPLVDYYLTRNRFLIAKRYGGLKLTLSLIKEALTRNWSSPIRRAAFTAFVTNNFGNKNEKISKITKTS